LVIAACDALLGSACGYWQALLSSRTNSTDAITDRFYVTQRNRLFDFSPEEPVERSIST